MLTNYLGFIAFPANFYSSVFKSKETCFLSYVHFSYSMNLALFLETPFMQKMFDKISNTVDIIL